MKTESTEKWGEAKGASLIQHKKICELLKLDYPAAEIAARLNIPVATVRSSESIYKKYLKDPKSGMILA